MDSSSLLVKSNSKKVELIVDVPVYSPACWDGKTPFTYVFPFLL
jgi:hypothetical protein